MSQFILSYVCYSLQEKKKDQQLVDHSIGQYKWLEIASIQSVRPKHQFILCRWLHVHNETKEMALR